MTQNTEPSAATTDSAARITVAIVGMACRFPDAKDHFEFWKNLKTGRNSIREIPYTRWDIDQYYSPDFDAPNRSVSKWGGLLQEIDQFDHGYFSISPREANNMDPHQRLLLEETVHCIEDAAIPLSSLREKRTSVFVGVTELDYYLEAAASGVLIDRYACFGNFPCFLANRISYALGLTGQSMSLDTACASSLTAIHEAKRSLLNGECDYAMAASACLISHPWKYISFSKARMLSPDGQCRTFDKEANGFVPGEGVGVLLLQRLDDALKEGARILGVVRGTAVNHGGRGVSLSAPRVEAQRDVILAAFEDARTSPETVTYVEAHGTGTPLGDPIEIEALTQAFRKHTDLRQFCKIGSVKTNIGHLGPAAGMASAIKVLLMMRHHQIPPSLNVQRLSPIIDFEASPFAVARELSDWRTLPGQHQLRAGVSAFGVGGSNAHILLESYQTEPPGPPERTGAGLFLLSAKTRDSLERVVQKWKRIGDSDDLENASLQDICRTLQAGREAFPHRFGACVSTKSELLEAIRHYQPADADNTGRAWCARFGELSDCDFTHLKAALATQELFQRHFDRVSAIVRKYDDGTPARTEGAPADPARWADAFLTTYSLFSGLTDMGFTPSLITGEKTGVWIALALSGAIAAEDAIPASMGCKSLREVRFTRPTIPFYDAVNDRLINPYHFDEDYVLCLAGIRMENEIVRAYAEKARLLAENHYAFKETLNEWHAALKTEGIDPDRLLLDEKLWLVDGHLAHGNALLPVAIIVGAIRKLNTKWGLSEQRRIEDDRFFELLDLLEDGVMTKEMFVSLVSRDQPDIAPVARQLDQRQGLLSAAKPYTFLRKNRAIDELQDAPAWIEELLQRDAPLRLNREKLVYFEIGRVSETMTGGPVVRLDAIHDLEKDLREVLLGLWLEGVHLDWDRLGGNNKFQRVSLPGYCFVGRRFWREGVRKAASNTEDFSHRQEAKIHPLIGRQTSSNSEQHTFETRFVGDEFYLADHVVTGHRVLPGAAHIEMARAGGELACERTVTKIQDVVWVRPFVTTDRPQSANLIVNPTGTAATYQIVSSDETSPTVIYSKGRLIYREQIAEDDADPAESRITERARRVDLDGVMSRCRSRRTGAECYDAFEKAGVRYGEGFRAIQEACFNEREALSRLKLPERLMEDAADFGLHPSLADAAIQTALTIDGIFEKCHKPLLPFSLGEIEFLGPFSPECYAYAALAGTAREGSSGSLKVDVCLADESGRVIVRAKDLYLRTAADPEIRSPLDSGAEGVECDIPEQRRPNEIETELKDRVERLLKELLSRETDQAVEEIHAKEPFESYGIDSVMILSLTSALEEQFGELPTTLFFEYRSISELANYFLENHKEAVYTKYGDTPGSGSDPAAHKPDAAQSAMESRAPRSAEYAANSVHSTQKRREIAIIGLSGRYPKAPDLSQFWLNLREGKDCISEIPVDRWDYRTYYDPDKTKSGTIYTKWGGFIDDLDKFDPLFFNISRKEAELIDPQERLFLETVYHTLEDAGYTKQALQSKRVGVFAGAMWSEYQLLGVEESQKGNLIAPTSQIASIANRVSFFFNFRGPSIGVDTMCSSSLTAIQLAVEGLRKGDIDMAIAGGVNVSVHPSKYIFLSNAKFASTDGRCRSFGDGGDGYVPGEGVGAVLLKPLEDAIQDGDHIYGVILGASLNHGGQTNGYTIPNPQAQADLILRALDDAGIDPRTINYVEAHGTGTSLGDPIEILGLSTAFGRYTKDRRFCAIGSVKSNIGHLESAAGIAGLTKILLQMKHRQLVPSIHSQRPNGNISFDDSPFVLQHELADWEPVVLTENGAERRYPRRAAISAFGAGGSNAHIVIEEFENSAAQAESSTTGGTHLIVISARDEERLRAYARDLHQFLKENGSEERALVPLGDVAYTLQIGRAALRERVAVVVSSLSELVEKLDQFLQGRQAIDHLYVGRVRKGGADVVVPSGMGARPEDLCQLAELWTSGAEVDWARLHRTERPSRVSLPVYPFAKYRCWVPKSEARIEGPEQGPSYPRIHPLLGRNNSTLREEKFTTRFSGNEFYLAEHTINGQKVLPAVALLEMARAAGALAGERNVVGIDQVVWARPIVVAGLPSDVETTLSPARDGVNFEVTTRSSDLDKTVHEQGRLVYEDGGEARNASRKRFDTATIRARCPTILGRRECYERFRSLGFEYGVSFQPIQELFHNGNESMSVLEAPEERREELSSFELNLSLMDGALQTAIGLIWDSDSAYVPFTLRHLEIRGGLTSRGYAYARRIGEASSPNSTIRTFDIDLLDESGSVTVRMEALSLKKLDHPPRADAERERVMYFQPEWLKHNPEPESRRESDSILVLDSEPEICDAIRQTLSQAGQGQAPVIRVEPGRTYERRSGTVYSINPESDSDYQKLFSELNDRGALPGGIVHLWAKPAIRDEGPDVADQLNAGMHSLFHISHALLAQKVKRKIRLLYVYLEEEDVSQALNGAVGGFAKTMRLEYPSFEFKTIQMPPARRAISATRLSEIVLAEFGLGPDAGVEIRYDEEGRRWRRAFQECTPPRTSAISPLLRNGGVYLITGGGGGLGLIFAEYLARNYRAKLVLCGRSDLDLERQRRLSQLESSGSEALYVKADISNHADVEALISSIHSRFGRLHGVIHAAGIIRDSFFLKKTIDVFDSVLKPKVYGTILLDEATRNEDLDFFVLFSSITSAIGNIGQSDYAYGNCFMDYYAELRERLLSKQERKGRTLSINWPLWRSGGMTVDEKIQRYAEAKTGLEPLETKEGLAAFEKALSAAASNLVVAKGAREKIRTLFGGGERSEVRPRAPEDVNQADGGELSANIRKRMVEIVCDLLKLDARDVDPDGELSEHGVDSLGFTALAIQINALFHLDLTPAVFFEYPSINSLVRHLCTEHRAKVAPSGKTANAEPLALDPEGAEGPAQPAVKPRFLDGDAYGLRAPRTEPVAIIGISGVMPQSDNLDEFWKSLVSEKDLISEIPPERWDWRTYYGNPAKEPNRTNVKWGGFMRQVDEFDNLFFGISPREAELMDPQQRIFLQTAWKAIEDAGYRASDLSGTRTGLFVGVAASDYSRLLRDHGVEVDAYTATGISNSLVANRISYLLNLRGPSEPIDTACSSSLVAVHRGAEAIQNGACDMAIVGGVNVLLDPMLYISFSKAGMLSEDGRCKTFDKQANGYVRGEGCGALLLKRLGAAEADGDHIYAVIRGSSENHGGRANSLTAPNPNAQAELLVDAYERAGIDPETVSYIETHGTGTSLGDPIEINGLKKAFEELYRRKNRSFGGSPYCGLGSVKTNIGHLEAAAGIAGLLKVVLSIKHETLPASLHFHELNPYVQLQGSPFYILDSTRPWAGLKDKNGDNAPRRAGVSSFGFGGVNAHVVLEEYDGSAQRLNRQDADPDRKIIVLSAKNEERLKAYANDLAVYLERAATTPATDESFTLFQTGVVKIAAEILSVDPSHIDVDEEMDDYGFDRFGRATWLQSVNEAYGLELNPAVLSDFSTISSFCQYCWKTQSDRLRASSGKAGGASAKNGSDLPSLEDIAYTLQVGREALEERLAVLAADGNDLLQKLRAYCSGADPLEWVYRGTAQRDRSDYASVLDGEEGESFLKSVTLNRKSRKIAALWAQGCDIPWPLLYNHRARKRVSLPTYPFQKTRFWFQSGEHGNHFGRKGPIGLHPLIDSNESTLAETSYRKALRAEDFYLRDHVIQAKRVLPAAAQLEMARAAGSLATGNCAVRKLTNVLWAFPIEVQRGLTIDIRLHPVQDGAVNYRITTSKSGEEDLIHSKGTIEFGSAASGDPVNISALKERMGIVGEDRIYETFSALGIEYGSTFRSVREIYLRDNEVLSRLVIPDGARANSFELHPSLADGALQTIAYLHHRIAPDRGLFLPFSLGALEIFAPLTDHCFAHGAVAGLSDETKGVYDIALYDDAGNKLALFQNLTLKKAEAEPHHREKERIGEPSGHSTQKAAIQDSVEARELVAKMDARIRTLVSKTLKINENDIDPDATLSDYGMDSIAMMEMLSKMEDAFGTSIDPTVFFDYPTVASLSRYFVERGLAGSYDQPAP